MLWIDRNAAVETSPCASASKMIAASSRARPEPPSSGSMTMAGEAERRRGAHRVDRETPPPRPTGRVRGELGRGERRGGVLDRPLIVGESEVHQLRKKGSSGRGAGARTTVETITREAVMVYWVAIAWSG